MYEQQINNLLRTIKTHTKVKDPPDEYLQVEENTEINKTVQQLKVVPSFYKVPNTDSDMITIAAQLNKNRKHYLKEIENHARDKVIQKLIQKEKEAIKNYTENADGQREILNLMANRHKWRSHYRKYDLCLPKICKIETCPNICVEDSDYCINHVMNDQSNKLFLQCTNCKRVHLINMPCLICGKE